MIPRPFLAVSPAAFLLLACGQTDDAATAAGPTEDPTAALIARGDSLEIPGEWSIPPGDPLVHATAGFAKILCSNVFLSGLDPQFAAANTGFFSSPAELRGAVTDTVVDYENRRVHLTLPDGTVRSAKVHGDQGCVALPVGESEPYYEAVDVVPDLPDPATTPWPLGDVLPDEPFPADVDMEKVTEAVAAAFDPPEALTAAFVVTHRGRLLAERYREGISHDTPLESWSMGKSLTGTLMGVLIHKGVYELWQPAPIPEWQAEGDGRAAIRVGDIMRMSSGLRFRAPQDPDFDPDVGYADHIYVYTGTVNSFAWAASKDQQWEPNTVGRYRNSDPVITNYLVRLGVEAGAGRELPRVSAAAPLRQARDPQPDPRDRSVRQLPPAGLRVRQRPRLGPARQSLPDQRRRSDRGADSAGRVRGLCSHPGARMGGGRSAPVRGCVLLGEPGRAVPGARQRILHGGGRWPEHDRDPVARDGGGAPGSLHGARPGRGPAGVRKTDMLRRALELLMEAVPPA